MSSAWPQPSDNESTPLVSQSGRRMLRGLKLYTGLWCIGAVALALCIGQNAGLVRCPLNDVPAAKKALLRQKWAAEREEYRVEAETWARSRAEYADEAKGWARERETHEKEREEHEKELAEWKQEREEEERHRLEVRRRSEGVYWKELRGDPHCYAYGTRAYHAYLMDVPGDLSWREVCYNMPPVVINGRSVARPPDECERNDGNDIVGTWYMDSGEPNCVTSWGWFSDKGCTPNESGLLRYEAPLENVRKGDDQQAMCATTPATVRDVVYDSPSVCQMRKDWLGKEYMVGIWDVPDAKRC